MSVYNDMASDAGYSYGSDENDQMAAMLEYQEQEAMYQAMAEEDMMQRQMEEEMMNIEFITCAAIKYKGKIYAMERPNRHCDLFSFIISENGSRIDPNEIQGFMTNKGRFLSRKEAQPIAENAGQVDGGLITKDLLTSEDMW